MSNEMSGSNSKGAIFITGTSSGIGKACAEHLARVGYTVFAGTREKCEHSSHTTNIIPVRIDVTDPASILKAKKLISNHTLNLTALINNAGVPLAGPIEQLNLEKFRAQIEVNVLGAIAITQAFLPLLREAKGTILNIGSISGRVSLPFLGPYAATKFSLEAISDALRVELKPWGIGVSIIEAGNVRTLIRQKATEEIKDDMNMLSPSALKLYGPIYAVANRHSKRKCMEPYVVAKLAERIIRSKKPNARYLLGSDAKLLALIQMLPTKVRDRVLGKMLPTYGPQERL